VETGGDRRTQGESSGDRGITVKGIGHRVEEIGHRA